MARNEERLKRLSDEFSSVTIVPMDLTEEGSGTRLFEKTGPVDILVNNAGIAFFGSAVTMDEKDVRHTYELNVFNTIDLCQKYAPSMLERGEGHICNVGSCMRHISGPPLTVYASTKSAVAGFTEGLRRELGRKDVKVSHIEPGPVATSIWERATNGDDPKAKEKSRIGIPPWMVAHAIVRAIKHDHVTGFATINVPRIVGLSRLFELPLFGYSLNLVAWITRRTPLARKTD